LRVSPKTLLLVFSWVVLAGAIDPLAGQSPRRVTVDDLMALRSVVDAKISPDGRLVTYAVSTPSVETNTHQVAIFMVPSDGGPATRLAADARVFTPALPVPRLRWLPDSRAVSFLGSSGNTPQVLVAPADGGPARTITSAPQGVATYEWSPDGTAVAYISRDAATPAPVIRSGTPDPPARLWLHALGSDARALTPPGQYVDSLSWAPDGSVIAYSAAAVTGFTAPYYTRIYAVTPAGVTRTVVDRAGMNTMPQFSPDGTLIAFVTTSERLGLMAPRGLAVVSAKGGAETIRTFPLAGAWVGEMLWARDSASIFALLNEGTFASGAQMFEMPVVRIAIGDGRATRVVQQAAVNYSLSLSRDGQRLAYRAVEGRTMGDVYVQHVVTGARTKLTEINPELRTLALGDLKPVNWRSFDGMEIWGLLLTPPGWDGKRQLPLLVYCHGGPIGGVTYGIFPQFAHTVGQVDPYPTEAMAGAGYAVLFPMPRGGSGYGEAGHRAIINGWGEGDYRDIMAGVDHLIATGIADRDRLGVMGASYGGFMTNWIVTQTARFKAASAGASISDLADMYYLPDGGDLMIEYFQRPWQNRESYIAHSPITHVEKVTTPILVQHGERDPRVPMASAQKWYRALKGLGKIVEYDFYPGAGHVYTAPVQQRESFRRNLDWFQRWIPTATP
jgi:dipeptidyl aminopeptidase/acylaminoacyl peptidase